MDENTTVSTSVSTGAVKVAKARKSNGDEPVRLSDGVWARILSVPATIVDEAQQTIKDPDVPIVYIEEKDREEPNPNDPAYLKALQDAQNKRARVSLDALIMFGVELVDEDGNPADPPDNGWEKRLKFAEKRGLLNLEGFDLDDPIEREFAYKKFVVSTNQVLQEVTRKSGVTEEAIEQASRSFRGETT